MSRGTAILIVIASIWVVVDAKSIGVKRGQIKGFANMGPWGWFFACVFLFGLLFPFYLSKRDEFKRINSAHALERARIHLEEVTANASLRHPSTWGRPS